MTSESIWTCKIGGVVPELPGGQDLRMRRAVEDAFLRVTGVQATFNFTGWGGELSQVERDVVDGVAYRPQPMRDERTTYQRIRDFSEAFDRPVNHSVVDLSVTERLLLGKLMFEECVEYVTKGLGLKITGRGLDNGDFACEESESMDVSDNLELELNEGQAYDPIESADGLGDIGVIAYFNSNWHGWNLDDVIAEIDDSNMSKLDHDGKPIINGQTDGYRRSPQDSEGTFWCDIRDCDEPGWDESKPMGKILKGPNYRAPDIAGVIYGSTRGPEAKAEGKAEPNLPAAMLDSSTIAPRSTLDHCLDHPDQTTVNCDGGYGLAGGGMGSYYLCGTCHAVFGKTEDTDDED